MVSLIFLGHVHVAFDIYGKQIRNIARQGSTVIYIYLCRDESQNKYFPLFRRFCLEMNIYLYSIGVLKVFHHC